MTLVDLWGEQPPPIDLDDWFDANVDDMVGVIAVGQRLAVAEAEPSTVAALAAEGVTLPMSATPNPEPLVGVAGDGRPLDSLLYGAVEHAREGAEKRQSALGDSAMRLAWRESGLPALLVRGQTAIADASRQAVGLSIIARPGCRYRRIISGSACSRCAVLAGRIYKKPAFERHPGCNCGMVATSDRTTRVESDPQAFFDSLSAREQERRFTRAGARAIREGADISQVVNARRGASGLAFASGRLTREELAAIRRGRLRGRLIAPYTTNEGITRRGVAGRAMRDARRAGRPVPVRLMPEAIYQAAGDDVGLAARLLRDHGYLRPQPPLATRAATGPGRPSPASLVGRRPSVRPPTVSGPAGPATAPGPGGPPKPPVPPAVMPAAAAPGPDGPAKRVKGMLGPDTGDELPRFLGHAAPFRRSEVETFDELDATIVLDGDGIPGGHGYHRAGSGAGKSELPEGWDVPDVIDLANAILDNPSDGRPGRRAHEFGLLGSHRGVLTAVWLRQEYGGKRWRISTLHPITALEWAREHQ